MSRKGIVAGVATVWMLSSMSITAQGPPPGVGRPVAFEGELDVLYEDGETDGRLLYFLDTPARRIPLRFRGEGPDMPSRSRVRITGNLADDGSVTTTEVTTMAVSATGTFGELPVLVILFNFSSNPVQPYTPAAAATVNTQVRDFYMENSYRQTSLTFAVTGWHTITASTATCDYWDWATLADAAAIKAGFNLAAYDRRVYAFPHTGACSWVGLGDVSGPRSWINGGYRTRVVAHEQGHNFGNRHSHARKCDSAGCVNVNYGDDRDVLGAGSIVGHLNAFQKERLGWLNYGASPVIQTVNSSNDYWIDNYETLGGNVKGLKIWNAANGTYYYIETRERVGFDTGVPPGVTLHTGSPSSSDSSYQIDLAPSTSTWDSTLDVGQAVTDAALGVTMTTLSAGLDGALVRVTFGGPPCVPVAPAVALSPSTQSGAPGATLKYTLTVTNKSGAGCAASLFTASAAVPTGWGVSLTPAAAVSLAPGASSSIALSVTAPAAASGSYSFKAAVADGTSGLSTSATGTANIGAVSLAVNISGALTSEKGNSRFLTFTVTAKNGSDPLSGATANITITAPTGGTSNISATTNASGVAVAKYSLKPKDPSGTYQAKATVSAAGATATATTTVAVP